MKRPQIIESLERRTYFSKLAFSLPTHFATGANPTGVVAVDLTHDNTIDLVTSDFSTASISVLMGNGNGTFTTPVSYAVGDAPEALATGDFNGDGIPDIVTANEGSNTVSILMGNGDGTFSPQVTYPVGMRPEAVAVGSLDNNGLQDIVVANQGSNTVSVLINNGDGTFQPAVNYFVGEAPDGVALGDFTGNGLLDIVTVNPPNSNLHVLLNNGDATFGHLGTYETGLNPRAVTVADVNSSGRDDIITANLHNTNISILDGLANGTFQTQQNFGTGVFPFAVTVADMNGDGRPDIITANNFDTGVGILLHNTMGSYSLTRAVRSGNGPVALAIADVNGDGKPDIITADFNTSEISVVLNRTVFVPLIPSTVTLTPGQTPVAADNQLRLSVQITPDTMAAKHPVGLVQFFDNYSVVGVGVLSPSGVASISTNKLTLGTHVITANYSGDGTYGDSVSEAVTETVIPVAQGTPLVTPTIKSVKLPPSYVAGDRGVVNVSIEDTGAGPAKGVVGVKLYASLSGTFDSTAIPIAVNGNSNVSLKLVGGTMRTVGLGFTVPSDLAAANYTYFAALVPVSGLTSDQVATTVATGTTTANSVMEFGKVGAHRGYRLTHTLANGNTITIGMTGPGTGVLSENSDGGIAITLTGTGPGSNLTISGDAVNIDSLTATGGMGNVLAANATATGAISLDLGVRKLTLAGATNSNIVIAGGAANTLSLGTLAGVYLFSAAPIVTLTINSYSNTANDQITTAWIGTLNCGGDFGAKLTLNGGNGGRALGLKTAIIRGTVNPAVWSIQKNVGTLQAGGFASGWSGSIHGTLSILTDTGDFSGNLAARTIGKMTVSGDLSNAAIFAGANFGADGKVGGGDDVYGSGILTSLLVNGSVINSLVGAGYVASNASLLSKSAIGSISVSGTVDASSLFTSVSLPNTVNIGGAMVSTLNNTNFRR